ncbi:MAG: hypothetical protein JWN13_2823 [Betaproteobacteria bacterium]|nr:hypothetical protein [Betaproteobacteria bacterium]
MAIDFGRSRASMAGFMTNYRQMREGRTITERSRRVNAGIFDMMCYIRSIKELVVPIQLSTPRYVRACRDKAAA